VIRLDAGAQTQDPRLNLTHRVDDEVGKEQHQQQAEPATKPLTHQISCFSSAMAPRMRVT
jgi:hypothetical protein